MGGLNRKLEGELGCTILDGRAVSCSGRRLAIEGGLKARCLMKGYREVKQIGDVSL
jgi:hypothetical protein